METAPKRILENIREAKLNGNVPTANQDLNARYFPSRVRRVPNSIAEMVTIKTDMVVGRAFWIFAIRHMLTSTLKRLQDHRWTVLEAHPELPWFTSDDPVVQLNYQDSSHYDFGGGWGSTGTEIMLPISPRHLLYTQVGKKPPSRGTFVSEDQARCLRRIIAEHAHRMIYSKAPDLSVEQIRPRHVSEEAVTHENQEWRKWHAEQSEAERELSDLPTMSSEVWSSSQHRT